MTTTRRTIDVSAALTDLCKQLRVSPRDVARIEIRPRSLKVVIYRRDSGGDKYVDKDGEAAIRTITYPASM